MVNPVTVHKHKRDACRKLRGAIAATREDGHSE
jgi:hypothetical protein